MRDITSTYPQFPNQWMGHVRRGRVAFFAPSRASQWP